jgi:hypothetical protein
MDEVKGKFRGLFAKASNAAKLGTSKKFQGQGNRLGTAEVGTAVHVQLQPEPPIDIV